MSFGVTELAIILVIVLLLFGTTKLKSIGNDLGSAIKGFKSAVAEDETDEMKKVPQEEASETADVADAKVQSKQSET